MSANETIVDEEQTLTVLRRWPDGDVIALFPLLPTDVFIPPPGRCESYMHIGQHGAADYHHVVRKTRPASPEEPEAAALLAELRQIGYRPKLRRRLSYREWQEGERVWRELRHVIEGGTV